MGIATQEELNTRLELEALAEELNDFLETSYNMKIYEENVSFVSDQYQRLFDKGVIIRLDDDIRKSLREAFTEIRLIDRLISAAWHSGQGSNIWATNLNGASKRILDNRDKVMAAYNALRTYLATFS